MSANYEYEAKQLPVEPWNMTFRGRYSQQDQEIAQRLAVTPGTEVTMLDFAGGVMPFGSPTAHDFIDTYASLGGNATVTVVDSTIPDDLTPSYPDVNYFDQLDKVESHTFDVVRALHVIEHMKPEDYKETRQQLVDRTRDGGILVVTQRIWTWSMKRQERIFRSPMIKVMQKRGDALMPVMLLPDTYVPWNGSPNAHTYEEHLEDYHKFREKVTSGKVSIKPGLDSYSFDQLLTYFDNPYDSKNQIEKALHFLVNDQGLFRNDLIEPDEYIKEYIRTHTLGKTILETFAKEDPETAARFNTGLSK